jgi:acetyl-CoA acetyltransferase
MKVSSLVSAKGDGGLEFLWEDGERVFCREWRRNDDGKLIALGHPFGATDARILSQAVKKLSTMPSGERAIVSICADGGQGTVALLQAP